MEVTLRRLTTGDGRDVYEMLQELPANENGFINGAHGKSFDEFKQWLLRCDDVSQGIGLEDWMVPQTTYWLFVNGVPVGVAKLRHRLTEKLRQEGGHIGYAIRPGCRGKGYGSLQLKLVLAEARKLGIDRALVTVSSNNLPSQKTALSAGGVLEKVSGERHYFWIPC